jgi:hypothetical protein
MFIGSSREASLIAKALQHELRDVVYSELWSQGLFRLGSVGLDDLVRAANGFDFAAFVFAPDDIIKMREKQYSGVRDNVLFELGIFIGRLGPQRSFFIVPDGEEQFHVPSDLSGITPAKYDSRNSNLQVAVASASFEISRSIALMGPVNGKGRVLYDAKVHGETKLFRGRESFMHRGSQRVGDQARAAFVVGAEGLLKVSRSNNAGRYEIHYRPQGPSKPSFTKTAEPPPQRPLRVTCEMKAEGASHTVRFVAKDEDSDKWLASETRRVPAGDWSKCEFYLWVDATRDFLLRIDDEEVSEAPTTLEIRDLLIVDEN